ncbi:MAG TPA: ImmA/IrrE family metallo-endopeptidase [Candidatus Aquicultor sp.]
MAAPQYTLEVRGKAQEIRDRFGLGVDAISDIFHFLEEQGILVARRPMGEDGPDGIYAKHNEDVLIAINNSRTLGRQRFTAAHEYAHHLFDNDGLTIDHDIFDAATIAEKRANAFAAHLLMPESGVRSVLGIYDSPRQLTPHDVVHLQRHFGVSYQAALYHILNLGVISKRTREEWVTLKPRKLALEIGYFDVYEDADKSIKHLPAAFVKRAIKAYEQADISLNKLAELLEKDPSELHAFLVDRGISQKEPSILEGADDV